MAVTKDQDRNLLDAAEELFGYSPCMHCAYFKDDEGALDELKCEAFPDGIPDEIFDGHNLHKELYPGDHGITFRDIDEEGEGKEEEGEE